MLRYLIDMDRLGKRPYWKLGLIGLFLLIVATVLYLLLPSLPQRYSALVGYGMLSFAISVALPCAFSFYVALRCTLYSRKHHRELWKKSWSRSWQERCHASMALRALCNNEPRLRKILVQSNRFGSLCFLVWLIIFLAVTAVVITIDISS